MGGAFAAKREKTEGSIEVGKLADVILISQDLFKIAPNQIGKTKVMMTMVGGKVVYQDPSWRSEQSAASKSQQSLSGPKPVLRLKQIGDVFQAERL
jgi:urease alpha subunit